MRLESDFEDTNAAVQEVPEPMLAERAAAAQQNAGLERITGVPRQTTGVDNAPKLVDLTGEDSDDDDDIPGIPKLAPKDEYDSDDEDDGPPAVETVKEEEESDTPVTEVLGRGTRIRKQPSNYVPSMRGKKCELGVTNLCYRGNKYKLKDGVISLNIDTSAEPSLPPILGT